jgi:hypothetical protein
MNAISLRSSSWLRGPGHAAAGVLLVASTTGCSALNAYEDPAAVGDWQSREATAGGRRSSMSVELEGDGSATLNYVLQSDPATALEDEFSLRWEQVGESKFELRMQCETSSLLGTGCASHDFTMSCAPEGGGDELECTGNGIWATFNFQWERE